MRLAAITERGSTGFALDDESLPGAFAELGIELVPTPWGSDFAPDLHAALVRTPWDYFLEPEPFLAWIEALDVPVLNDPRVLRWNHHKGYLPELRDAGVAEIPATLMLGAGERPEDSEALCRELGAERIVVKPAISGGGHRTRRLGPGDPLGWTGEDVGDYIAQAYVDEIERTGEWSVMCFGGRVSHAVRKTPSSGNFLVQSEHGGGVHSESPPAELAALAERIVAGVPALTGDARPPVYARVDLVTPEGAAPQLMELELIEPELFFRVDDTTAPRFAQAVRAELRELGLE